MRYLAICPENQTLPIYKIETLDEKDQIPKNDHRSPDTEIKGWLEYQLSIGNEITPYEDPDFENGSNEGKIRADHKVPPSGDDFEMHEIDDIERRNTCMVAAKKEKVARFEDFELI